MRWMPATLVALALAVAPAAAAPLAEIKASGISSDGGADLSGALSVLSLSEHGTALDITGFHLRAASANILLEHEDTNRSVAGLGAAPTEYWRESLLLADADVALKAIAQHPDIFVVPRGRANLQFSSAPLAGAAGADAIEQDDHIRRPERQPTKVDTSGATTWSGKDAQLDIQGDFLVVLWDLTFKAGDRTVRTGSWLEDTGTPLVQRGRSAQAWLEVRDGTLTLGLAELKPRQLHVEGATISSASGLTFTEAEGTLAAGDQSLDLAGTVELRGALAASVEPQESRLRSVVSGTADEILVDSKAFAVPAAPGTPAWTWTLVPILVALPLAGAAWRRRLNEAAFLRMRSAMQSADYGSVVAVPPRRLRSGRHAPEAAVMRATAYIRLGQDAKAGQALDQWPVAAYPWDRDFLRAHLHARRGDWAKATAALRAALSQSPTLAEAAAADPLLRRLADTPAREGYT